MNYRHAYHAGNFADVVKHVVLVHCLEHLKKKPAPFRVVDAHAGAGVYDLTSPQAGKTGEWHEGAGRVLDRLTSAPAGVVAAMAPWRDAVRRHQPTGTLDASLSVYPGSPALIADALRADDTLYAVERHPEDHRALTRLFAQDRRVRTPDLDGWLAVKSLLPPAERRGLVLLDPPFEQPGDLQRLAAALDDGLSRFEQGLFLLWYPIKDPKPVDRFRRRIGEIIAARGVETALDVVLMRRAARHPEVLAGAGLLVINAPFTLEAAIAPALDWLADVLGETADAHGTIMRFGQ